MPTASSAARGVAVLLLCLHLPLLALAAPTAADRAAAKTVYDTLFAAKIKTVRSTADRADDVALAREMIAVATSSDVQPELLELICEGAYDLGQASPEGLGLAAEAMSLLAESVPEKRAAAHDRQIAILNRQITAGKPDERAGAADNLVDLLTSLGDENAAKKDYAGAAADYRRAFSLIQQRKLTFGETVKAKLDWATGRDRAVKQLARLQEKMLANANDHVTAQEIVKLFTIELDEPSGALPYLERAKDAKLTEVVTLAARPLEDLAADQNLIVGEWYFAAARDHDAFAATLLLQSRRHVARFIELYAATDIHRTKAEVILKETDAKLAAKKIVVAAAVGTDAPVNWTMRLWGGSRFVPRDMGNLDTKLDDNVITATHPARIKRSYVYLTNEHAAIPANVDFELAVRVNGKGAVGLLRKEGQQSGQLAMRIDSPTRVMVIIKRQAGKVSISVDGKPTPPAIKGRAAGEKDAYVFAIGLNPNDSVQVHDFKLKVEN